MTRSAGTSGLTSDGSPPRSAIASRMTARSTIAGTPVKSWRITRDGMNGISASAVAPGPPGRQRLDVLAADDAAAGMAEQVLEEDLQRDGRACHVQPIADGVEAEVAVPVVTDLQGGARAKGIDRGLPGCHRARLLRQPREARASRRRTGAPVPGRDRARV